LQNKNEKKTRFTGPRMQRSCIGPVKSNCWCNKRTNISTSGTTNV